MRDVEGESPPRCARLRQRRTGLGDVSVIGGVGGDADDVERFFVQHPAPVAVVDSVSALRETLTSTCIPTVAAGELEAWVAGEGLPMGAVQVPNALIGAAPDT